MNLFFIQNATAFIEYFFVLIEISFGFLSNDFDKLLKDPHFNKANTAVYILF